MTARPTRRSVLVLGGVAVAGAGAAGQLGLALPAPAYGGGGPTTVPRFAVDLPVPPVLAPAWSEGAVDHYRITARPCELDIVPGRPTPAWGYEGVVPGPTLRTAPGREAHVEHVNGLDVDLVAHLHGSPTRPEHDGYPYDTAAPGAAKTHEYPAQTAGTTRWYHDHTMDVTARNVNRGLSGFHLFDGDEPAQQLLPSGERDIVLHIDQKVVNADGTLFEVHAHGGDPQGDDAHGAAADRQEVVLVNGAPWPRTTVTNRLHRLRLLNPSVDRTFVLAFSQPVPAWVVATDSGLTARPVPVSELRLAQAERYDLLVDFGQVPTGTSVTLVDTAAQGATAEIVRFDVVPGPEEDLAVPEVLREVPLPDAAAAELTRRWFFGFRDGLWVINGRPWERDRVDAFPRLGSTEIWEVRNTSREVHPVHPHLADFVILERDGRPPLPYEQGALKDTCWVDPGETVRLALVFAPHRGRYVFHCHNLQHEDMMMMTQFEVV